MNDMCEPVDCLIFGGGADGLFALDACVASGLHTLLLERNTLGALQTIHSQGIIHGNLKHAVSNHHDKADSPTDSIPAIWRKCLAGETKPDLRNVTLRSEYWHVWGTDSILSNLGRMRVPLSSGLHIETLAESERPALFLGCPGRVARVNGQVVEPRSVLEALSQLHSTKILQTTEGGVEALLKDGSWIIRLLNPENGEPLDLAPTKIVLTAGSGNQSLRSMLGLSSKMKKKKYSSMVLVRGELPLLNGYCIDGIRNRLTITTATDYARRRVWQVFDNGTMQQDHKSQKQLIRQTTTTLQSLLPSIQFHDMEFTTYQTSLVEHRTKRIGHAKIAIRKDGDVLTCNQTDIALAPMLATEIVARIGLHKNRSNAPAKNSNLAQTVASWPRPSVAFPPWEADLQWKTLADM